MVLAVLAALRSFSAAAEFRGIWVDAFGPGFFDSEQVRKLVADCRKYNFNAVFVEMRRRGDAFYSPRPPNDDPRTTALGTNFDALAEIIKECHSGTPRIEVHCWLVSHFIWAWNKPPPQPAHVFNSHPEWLTKDSIGQRFIGLGYFLDLGNPDANESIHRTAVDIASHYNIDGLHWDYCRYPNQDSGYNEVAIRRFNEEFQLNSQPAPKDRRFSDWRRRQVTDFLTWVNADLWELKPSLVISIAVFANLDDAYGYRFSDWQGWLKQGVVDVCLPMNFSTNTESVFLPRLKQAQQCQGDRSIYMGQGAYLNSPEKTLTQLLQARDAGFAGVCLYSYRSTNEGLPNQDQVLSFLQRNFQTTWSNTPRMRWKETEAIIKGKVTDSESGKPIYNALVTLDSDRGHTSATEPHGAYAFFAVKPGHHVVCASLGQASVSSAVEVLGGQVSKIDLAVPR